MATAFLSNISGTEDLHTQACAIVEKVITDAISKDVTWTSYSEKCYAQVNIEMMLNLLYGLLQSDNYLE